MTGTVIFEGCCQVRGGPQVAPERGVTPSTNRFRLNARLARHIAAAARDPYRPLMAHVVVSRRCNLSCGYCTEYDDKSPPVPTEVLEQRFEQLARLGTAIVTLTGGEALLHPDITELVQRVGELGMVAALNTNAFLLTRRHVQELNDAGLYAMQISIDAKRGNDVTRKALKPLLPKLKLLAEDAHFRVRVNTVLGPGAPREALDVARAVMDFGFDAKCTFVRDEHGKLAPLSEEARRTYEQIRALGRRSPGYLSEDFQLGLMDEGHVDWKCRSGSLMILSCQSSPACMNCSGQATGRLT